MFTSPRPAFTLLIYRFAVFPSDLFVTGAMEVRQLRGFVSLLLLMMLVFWSKTKKRYTFTFEPFIGTLHIALGKRLPGPPSDWPALDRTDWWVKGSRHASLCLLRLGFTEFWLHVYLINVSTEPLSCDWYAATGPAVSGLLARSQQLRHEQIAKSPFGEASLCCSWRTVHLVITQQQLGMLVRITLLPWEESAIRVYRLNHLQAQLKPNVCRHRHHSCVQVEPFTGATKAQRL